MTMMGILLFHPLLPAWGLGLCLVIFAVCAWRTYAQCGITLWKRCFLFALRLAAFLIICWLMQQPVRRDVATTEEKRSFAIVVDESASMEDRLPGVAKTRGERAKGILASPEVAALGNRCNLRLYRLGEGLSRGKMDDAMDFMAGQTRLVAGLKELRNLSRSEHPIGVLLLTDGLDTSGQTLEGLALDVPLFIPELEDAAEIRQDMTVDYSVSLLETGVRRVVKGWTVPVRVNVNRLAGSGEDTVKVFLMREGTELESREVPFQESSRYAQTTFSITADTLGTMAYKVRLQHEHDSDDANNQADFVLEVTEDENRVMVLEGMLRPEFKHLKRALQKERSFQTSIYLRTGQGIFMNFEDSEDGSRDLSALLTDDNLKRYTVLVLGEFAEDSFTKEQLAAVKAYVEKGGGLLLAGSSRAYGIGGYLGQEAFGDISPVVSGNDARMQEGKAYQLTFTAAGRNDSIFMKLASEAVFSPLNSLWTPVTLKESATVFIETAEGLPLLVTGRYGEGRICIMLSNTLYSLRMRGTVTDGVNIYDRLMAQTLFWMMPDKKKTSANNKLQVLLKSDTMDVGQTVAVGCMDDRGQAADDVVCEVVTPDGKLATYPMQKGVLGAQVGLSNSRQGLLSEFRVTTPGTYTLELFRKDGVRSDKKLLVVQRLMLETTGAPINRELLKKLAADSHGQFIPAGQLHELFKGLSVPVLHKETVTEQSIWDSWLWLLPLMALFCLEWYFRRSWDLV